MVYTECAEMATASRGASHVTAKQRCKNTTSVDIQKRTIKKAIATHSVSLVIVPNKLYGFSGR